MMDNFPPLIYASESDDVRGMIPDRWALWEEKTGQKVELTTLEWSLAIQAFEQGHFDVIDAITLTPEREEKYLFSEPWISLDVVLYYPKHISGISDANSAQGFQIGVVRGDACANHLMHQGISNLIFYPAYADVVDAAAQGRISVFCGHQLMTNYFIAQRNVSDQFLHTQPIYSAPGHWAVRSDMPALRSMLQQGFYLFTEQEDQAIREKWLGQILPSPMIPIWVTWLSYSALTLLAVIFIILFWLRTLRRLVSERTQELENYRAHLEDLVEQRTQELRSLTENLQHTSKEQQAVFDTAMVGIMLLKGDTILRCNQSLEQMLDYPQGSLMGTSPREWFNDEAAYQAITDRIKQAISSQGFFSEEMAIRGKNQHPIWVKFQAQPIEKQDVESGVAAVLTDMSVEYQAREEIQKARLLAEDAARTKAEFLANMSHEIRTPMNAIMGMTHLALQTDLNPDQQNYLEKIHRSGRHLLAVINDILDFSKIEAGKLVLEQTTFDLHRLMKDIEDTLQPSVTEKDLKLLVVIDTTLPQWFQGDSLRIQQVLLNFGNNAVKFTEAGKLTIQVQAINQHDRRFTLHFSVKDTGIGLSQEQQSKLFRSFEQADNSITRKYGGSGLGLAISKQLVELMSGEIGVTSELGKGSTFWFQIDLTAVVDAREIIQAEKDSNVSIDHLSATASDSHKLFHDAKVLLVEDNVLNQEVALALLHSVGIHADLVENGADALQAVDNQSYDLVLMDVQMPVMDGLTATRKIREKPNLKDLPIIAMTASVLSSDRDACMDAGMNAHIAKPIEPDVLRNLLAKWLSHESNRATEDTSISLVSNNRNLPNIEGLDIDLGSRLVMNNIDIYNDLIKVFVANRQHFPQELEDAIAQNDKDKAVRLVHTLKGNLAQLGATELANTAQGYELILKKTKDKTNCLPRPDTTFLGNFSKLINDLAAYLMQEQSKSNHEIHTLSTDNESHRDLYQTLHTLLATDNVEAGKLLRKESVHFLSLLGNNYQLLLQKVENFEFPEALALLESITK